MAWHSTSIHEFHFYHLFILTMSQIDPLELATLKETIKEDKNVIQDTIDENLEKGIRKRSKDEQKEQEEYIQICNVKFPTLLVPTGDHSMDPERIKIYIQMMLEEHQKPAEIILRNTQYIDFITFIQWFKIALDNFKYHFSDKQDRKWLAFMIKRKSSGLWMTLLAMCIDPTLKETCSGLFEATEDAYRFVDEHRIPTDINTFVLFDDCIYTGLQIGQSIRWLPTLLNESSGMPSYIHIHIITPVISINGVKNIIEKLITAIFIHNHIIEHDFIGEQASQFIKRYILTVFKIEPGLCMAQRSILIQDIISQIIPSYFQQEGLNLMDQCKSIKLYFHYGHTIDVLSEEIANKPYINEFQYKQHNDYMKMIKEIKKYFGYKHAIYFQHKVPDAHSSYESLYYGWGKGDHFSVYNETYPILRNCKPVLFEDRRYLQPCPQPPYKQHDLLTPYRSWFKKLYLKY